ncbi:MAG: hypothetical protein ACK5IB_01460 [Qingshengfaniella sp.]
MRTVTQIVAIWMLAGGLMVPPLAAQQTSQTAPGQILNRIAPVGPANSSRARDGVLDVTLLPDPLLTRQPVVHEAQTGPADVQLRHWWARRSAAGLAGIVYDNRDRGHSTGPMVFPQVSKTLYAPVFKNSMLDYGIAGRVRFSLPVIGNSSTAITSGPTWRSQARAALQSPAAALLAYQLYATNALYFYPEHRDHDRPSGDMFFANTPYFWVSQGSSGSDRPFMINALRAIAALPPETRHLAEEKHLLPATVQMILRSTMAGVEGRAGYLSGAAHPSAFDAKRLDPLAVVGRAHALKASDLPPMVRLRVLADFTALPGVDYLARNLDEVLFTTPSAIARAWRSYAYRRDIVLSAAETEDPNGRPLRFHWVLLRGDPNRIQIAPADPAGQSARITIAWHDRYTLPSPPGLDTSRIDIGIFADNGAEISAPAFFSVTFPTFQNRIYTPGEDGELRLARLTYAGDSRAQETYADPMIWPVAPWSDRFERDSDGWIRKIERTQKNGTIRTLEPGLFGPVLIQPDGQTVPIAHSAQRDKTGVLRLRVDTQGTPTPDQ